MPPKKKQRKKSPAARLASEKTRTELRHGLKVLNANLADAKRSKPGSLGIRRKRIDKINRSRAITLRAFQLKPKRRK